MRIEKDILWLLYTNRWQIIKTKQLFYTVGAFIYFATMIWLLKSEVSLQINPKLFGRITFTL